MYFSIALMVIVQVALAIFPESVHGSGHRDGHAGENQLRYAMQPIQENRLTLNCAHLRLNDKKTRKSALEMSNPIMDFVTHNIFIKRRTQKKNWRTMKPKKNTR